MGVDASYIVDLAVLNVGRLFIPSLSFGEGAGIDCLTVDWPNKLGWRSCLFTVMGAALETRGRSAGARQLVPSSELCAQPALCNLE